MTPPVLGAGTGVLLAAHGSRGVGGRILIERHAALLRQLGLVAEVVTGYYQGSPSFSAALDSCEADRVVVVPLFTSAGYYTERVLPAQLRTSSRYGSVALEIAPPVGLHPRLKDIVADRVNDLYRLWGLPENDTTVLLIGHGTERHPRSRQATTELASTLSQRWAQREVHTAFLDDTPSVEAVLQRITTSAVVVAPFLLGGGDHATRDIFRRLRMEPPADPSLAVIGTVGAQRIVVDLPLGYQAGLTELIADLVRRHLPSAPAQPPKQGTVYLVGSGPGDPELITLRGLSVLRRADVVLHDRLIPIALLHEAPKGALLLDVGKSPGQPSMTQQRINDLLVSHARQGHTVVRLKGGDPFVFGRGAEEDDACRQAGVECSVVPGISSAIAVPAAAGIPVTARGISRSFAVLTAQTEDGDQTDDLVARIAALAAVDTLVILMGRAALSRIAEAAISTGRDPTTPVACIQEGTTPRQKVTVADLATIARRADADGLSAPMVTVIGVVATRAADAAALAALSGALV